VRRGLALAAATGVAILAWGEWINARWSRCLIGVDGPGREIIVVLGFRNPQAEANFINRWRVRAALRSADRAATSSCLVFSGGAVASARSEARVMAQYAVETCGYSGALLFEEESLTTWENITNVIPMLEDADRIKLVSQPAHGLKARVYLRRQRPDLAAKLAPAADYRPGEWLFLKPILAARGLRSLRTIRATERGSARSRWWSTLTCFGSSRSTGKDGSSWGREFTPWASGRPGG
jgi:uncharacterized SAM-binding protein YcdF (DUF218 family)